MAMRMKGLLAGLPLLLLVGCVQEDQLKRVEQEVADMKLEVFKMRQQVEEQNRRNERDSSSFSESRLQDRRFQADMQETLRQLQDATRVLAARLKDAPTQGRQAPAAEPTPQRQPEGDAQAFNAAMVDYNRGNYALAVENLEQFLAQNARSARRAEAFYYLGYSQFNLKAFDKSLRAFDRLIKEFPGSELFLSAKYRRAICQIRLGLKAAGIASLQEIVRDFPDTPEGRNASQELADLQ